MRYSEQAAATPSPWVNVAERAIVVSALAALLAAVLWQLGVGASAIIVVCVVGASIAGWIQPHANQQLVVQRVSTTRVRRTSVH